MKEMYITFDDFYNEENYNSFVNTAILNGIEFVEYLKIKPPHHRYLKISDKEAIPAYVRYRVADPSDIRWLVSILRATHPAEAFIVQRKPGQDNSYWNYILPNKLKGLKNKDYIMVFKSTDFTEMSKISGELGQAKIYKWGRARGYDIYYTFNPYIQGLLSERNVLLEFGKSVSNASSAIKKGKKIPSEPGMLEYYLNSYVLISEKLENKTIESEYWQNGKFTPLKRKSFVS